MQSPQDFMQSFLREKGDMNQVNYQRSVVLHRKFFSEEYVKSMQDWHAEREKNPEAVVSAEVSGTSAKVITSEIFAERQLRHRYLLQHSGSDWRIYGKEWECFACHGTGRKGTVDCPICGGVGWKDHRPQSAA